MFSWLLGAKKEEVKEIITSAPIAEEVFVNKNNIESFSKTKKQYEKLRDDLDSISKKNEEMLIGFKKKQKKLNEIISSQNLDEKKSKELNSKIKSIETTLTNQIKSLENFFLEHVNKNKNINNILDYNPIFQLRLYKYHLARAVYDAACAYIYILKINKENMENKKISFNEKFYGNNNNSVNLKWVEKKESKSSDNFTEQLNDFDELGNFTDLHDFFQKESLKSLETRVQYLLEKCYEKGIWSTSYEKIKENLEIHLQELAVNGYQFAPLSYEIENKLTSRENYILYFKMEEESFKYLTSDMEKPDTIKWSEIGGFNEISLASLEEKKSAILNITSKRKHTKDIVSYYELQTIYELNYKSLIQINTTKVQFSINPDIYKHEKEVEKIISELNGTLPDACIEKAIQDMQILESNKKPVTDFIAKSEKEIAKIEVNIYKQAIVALKNKAKTILKEIRKTYKNTFVENTKIDLANDKKEEFKNHWSDWQKSYEAICQDIKDFTAMNKKASLTQVKAFTQKFYEIEDAVIKFNKKIQYNNLLAADINYRQEKNGCIDICQKEYVPFKPERRASVHNLNLFACKINAAEKENEKLIKPKNLRFGAKEW